MYRSATKMIYQILLIVCATALTVASDQSTSVPISTRYITTRVTTLSTGSKKTFIATLCQQFSGEIVNATALLNNNARWNPDIGVLSYYIVDDPNKLEKDALCNNTDSKGVRVPDCVITKWTSAKDLYLKAQAGNVAAISFTLDLEFRKPKLLGSKAQERPTKKSPAVKLPPNDDYEYLTEIVTVQSNQRLVYETEALLEVAFCPNNFTTEEYKITSTVFGTDGISSYTQYVCDKLPCTVDNSLPQSNGNQLPNNNVEVTTASGQYSHLYVLVICWAGAFDPAIGNYVGEFQYSGSISRYP